MDPGAWELKVGLSRLPCKAPRRFGSTYVVWCWHPLVRAVVRAKTL